MRLLLIHVDFLEFEVKQPTPRAESLPEGARRGRFEEALVAFAAAEREDEPNPQAVAFQAAEEIEGVVKQVKAERVVLYPYAHLSPSLAKPSVAVKILDLLREELSSRGLETYRLPFGWYKAFKLSCKGHPLSELSRTITLEPPTKAEEPKSPSEYLILSPEGEEHELDLQDLQACKILEKYPSLKQFIQSEELGHKPGKEPPHIKLMRRLELVDHEPASDIGHLRFYPKGAMIKGLLEDLSAKLAREFGALTIETPALYKADEPDISEQAARFLQKDYRIKLPNRTLLLRFAADFGLFRMMRDVVMSYKQMPVRIFELSPSYRLEQSGECVGLKRLRAFTMPDLHCFCRDLKEGLEEYERLFLRYAELTDAMEIEYVIAFRVVKDFYRKNREFIARLVKHVKRPALIELLPERKHYWIVKHEFQAIDSVGGNAQLATIQLDIEDSERYGIFFVDERGQKRGCIILHSSMGSIERLIYAVLEEAAKKLKAARAPSLPLWLSPTQVRLLPVSEHHLERCLNLAEELEQKQIRVDVDDRGESVAKRVREAEQEWIPYIVVVGDRELKAEKLPVRVRGEGIKNMGAQELAAEIKEKTQGMPFRPLPLPKLLSARPTFAG